MGKPYKRMRLREKRKRSTPVAEVKTVEVREPKATPKKPKKTKKTGGFWG